MRVLFSARLDPVHPGHVVTIIRLAKKFGAVKVVILDGPKRKVPVSYAKQVMDEIFAATSLDVRTYVNDVHFANIKLKALEAFMPFDIYASGNMAVLKNIERLGFPIIYVDRAYHYAASDIAVPDE